MNGKRYGAKLEAWPSVKLDLLIAGALTLGGALARIPYLALIPTFQDEMMQTVYALNIWPGKFLPLVGNDPYTGPMFSYLLAICLRALGATPVAPRIIAMVLGAVTVGLTYLLARTLGLRWPWALLAGLLLAVNPHHIVIASRMAGATYVLPVFSTAFLLALALAVKRESGPWLVVAGAALGLAMQANPVTALVLPGVIVWFLAQPTGGLGFRKSSIGLRTCWPYLAASAFVLAYAPVIIYNVQNSLVSVVVVESQQTYVFQPASSLLAYANNLWRLTLQLCSQVGGVLEGEESFRDFCGLPLVLSAWAISGLIYTLRPQQPLGLPALAVSSQVLIMPWLSEHYGLTGPTRFTNQLTPLMVVAMSALAAGAWTFVHARVRCAEVRQGTAWSVRALLAIYALWMALGLWPLVPLFRYYEHRVAEGDTNAYYYAFYDEFIQQWRDDKIYVSDALGRFNPTEYFLTLGRVPYTLVSLGRLMEHLATGQETGRVVLVLNKEEADRARLQANLSAWKPPDIQPAQKPDYGVYVIADALQVRKPTFVLTDMPLTSAVRALQANLADQLGVIGYEPRPDKAVPGDPLVIIVYWKAISAMSDDYVGFLHLVGPDGRLAAQDDHELGRGLYRTNVWQPGQVIRERYELVLPQDAPDGDYVLRTGAYSFPSLQRLPVRSTSTSAQDDMITLGTVRVGP
jgi:4-amino-4-deoxy-L-arabinose transferase-like glycosyltransferase